MLMQQLPLFPTLPLEVGVVDTGAHVPDQPLRVWELLRCMPCAGSHSTVQPLNYNP